MTDEMGRSWIEICEEPEHTLLKIEGCRSGSNMLGLGRLQLLKGHICGGIGKSIKRVKMIFMGTSSSNDKVMRGIVWRELWARINWEKDGYMCHKKPDNY